MVAGFELYRTIEQDVKDNTELAKRPLEIPVLAIGARAGLGAAVAQFARACARRVTGVVMADTGHFISEERPGAFVALIEAFVAGEPIAADWRP
jgi:pimeloyl-ACP methyl ester carboxylesterase